MVEAKAGAVDGVADVEKEVGEEEETYPCRLRDLQRGCLICTSLLRTAGTWGVAGKAALRGRTRWTFTWEAEGGTGKDRFGNDVDGIPSAARNDDGGAFSDEETWFAADDAVRRPR